MNFTDNSPTPKSVSQRLVEILFSPHPSITDIGEKRTAQLTIALTFVLTFTNSLALVFVGRRGVETTFLIQIGLVVLSILAYIVSRQSRFTWGGAILVISLSLSGFANVLAGSDDPSSALYVTIPVAFVIGSALLPVSVNVAQFVGALIGIFLLPVLDPRYTFQNAGTNSALIVTLGVLVIVVQVFRNNVEKARLANAQEINKELRDLSANLEQRVSERTKALSTVAEVSAAASTILETDHLLQAVVDLSKERFGFYHAHIYLLNEAGDTLVLASGAGEVGRQMVAEGRSIPLDREQSLVARAAREKQGVTVNDVTQAPDFLPHPLLPDTRSELAVPMMVGENVLGVLDVQSELVGRFTEADVAIQTTLASQIASAIQNARSYTEIQRNQELLSDALEIARLADWEYDVERDLFSFNDHFYSIFHTTVEQVGGYKISSADYARNFVHPDDQPLVGAEIQRVMTAKERYLSTKLEHRIVFADGGVGYISVNIRVERDENGKILRWYGANQDVTERRQAEELNRRRAEQQAALNTISQKIQNATTVEAALQVAARELGHALGRKPTLVTLEAPVDPVLNRPTVTETPGDAQ